MEIGIMTKALCSEVAARGRRDLSGIWIYIKLK